jgi:hypothetical protein
MRSPKISMGTVLSEILRSSAPTCSARTTHPGRPYSRAISDAPPLICAQSAARSRVSAASGAKACRASEQRRNRHDGTSDHERPRPGEADDCRDHEIADEVIKLPTEPGAGLPLAGPKSRDRAETAALKRRKLTVDNRQQSAYVAGL